MARTRPQLVLASLGFTLLAAIGCTQFNNPEGWAGPTTTNGVLLASTDQGELSAFDRENFSTIWTFPTGREEPEIDLEAIYGAPLVGADTVYFGAYNDSVVALNLEDGRTRWAFPTDGPIVGGLTEDETVLYVATDEGTLYALGRENGEERERFRAGDSIWSRPLLAQDALFVSSVDGKLYALDAQTLEPTLWDEPFDSGAALISDPVSAGELILVGGLQRTLHAVNAETGEEVWSFDADNWFWGRPLVVDDRIYAPNLDGNLYALGLDGTAVWTFETEEPLRSTPVLVGDALVIVDRDGTVYGLDPSDEPERDRLLWTEAANKTVLSDPLVLEGDVFISAEGGDLFLVEVAEDPPGATLSRLDTDTGQFIRVVSQ